LWHETVKGGARTAEFKEKGQDGTATNRRCAHHHQTKDRSGKD